MYKYTLKNRRCWTIFYSDTNPRNSGYRSPGISRLFLVKTDGFFFCETPLSDIFFRSVRKVLESLFGKQRFRITTRIWAAERTESAFWSIKMKVIFSKRAEWSSFPSELLRKIQLYALSGRKNDHIASHSVTPVNQFRNTIRWFHFFCAFISGERGRQS